MITRYITGVRATFNPFVRKAKTARLFLSFLPANARQTVKIATTVLPRESREPNVLHLTFKDGKEMSFDVEKVGIKDVIEKVDQHSRLLSRQEILSGN